MCRAVLLIHGFMTDERDFGRLPQFWIFTTNKILPFAVACAVRTNIGRHICGIGGVLSNIN